MRDPKRIWPFLTTLAELWELYPDWRFMQLICNIQRQIGSDGFYIEDDKMQEMLRNTVDFERSEKFCQGQRDYKENK